MVAICLCVLSWPQPCLCRTNREITPLDYHFCYSELQRPRPGVVFLTIKLQWLPPLLLEGTHHFPPKHSISWRDEKTPPLRATYHDSTIVQSALFAASLVLINSSLAARSTVGFHLALLGVTSSWMVSQLTGAARLLCCDNISFDVEVLVLDCHASSLLLFLSILLGVDLTAVTRRGKPTGMTWKCDGGTQAAIMFDFYIYFSPSFFSPVDALPARLHAHEERCVYFSRLKNFNWLSLLSELVSQDAAEGAKWCIKDALGFCCPLVRTPHFFLKWCVFIRLNHS